MESFTGWTPDAVSLVERSIAAHGGRQLWQSTASIRLPFRSGSGSLLALKGYQRTFPAPREFEVFPHECITVFHGYPKEGQRGCFADGDVRIENADGCVRLESRNHRRTFKGFAKLRCWSPLDALYFFGYALWHYHVLPFTLGLARLHRVLRRRGVPEGVDVIFPEGVHTHCRRQQFYFGADGRIVRHDYTADIIGPMARGSHFWEEYDQSGGLLIARRRRVVVRLGPYPTTLEVLRVQMGEPVFNSRGPS
jgi:hypothetical protein